MTSEALNTAFFLRALSDRSRKSFAKTFPNYDWAAEGERIVKQFTQEAHAMAFERWLFKDKELASIYAYGDEDDRDYLAKEFCKEKGLKTKAQEEEDAKAKQAHESGKLTVTFSAEDLYRQWTTNYTS